jgi:hypothetical protein
MLHLHRLSPADPLLQVYETVDLDRAIGTMLR